MQGAGGRRPNECILLCGAALTAVRHRPRPWACSPNRCLDRCSDRCSDRPASSLVQTRLTPSAPSGLTRSSAVTERCSARCWSC